jgi:crotonobetainyl-CoA:carnitine CoA-transferase CaiB-like acyl-CoA transferase
LEPKFWRRLCELIGLPELESRAFEPRLPELERLFASRTLAEWLALFGDEDVCVGPVATLAEAATDFSSEEPRRGAPTLGQHTDAWRAELQL